jgi:hypothetical protein
MTGEAAFECRIRGNGDEEVIPAERFFQTPGPDYIGVGWQRHMGRPAAGVSAYNLGANGLGSLIAQIQRDGVTMSVVVGAYLNIRIACTGYAAFESPEEAVRAIH